MLITISPAKKLDFTPVALPSTTPAFLEDTAVLAKAAQGLSVADLRKLMHLSEDLAKLNHERFQNWQDDPVSDATKPAVMSFAGDTYVGLDAKTLSEDDLRWAQDHLRILSGIYGVLRPQDAIQPYRLEMGSRLANPRGKNLYEFWGDKLALHLNAEAAALGTDVLVNCASEEYFTAAKRAALKLRVITPTFLEEKDGKRAIVSFYAKRARGAMARFIIENRLTDPKDLQDFATGGYRFDPETSTADKPVFLRIL